jgi:hypothetical protein
MPNAIKYSTSAQTLALKKGNFWIGTGDVPKGPTSTTDYWSGITPPAGGYTIYLNKSVNGPSIYVASNDSQLIDFTNRIAGANYTTATECFNYYAGQSDKMVLNEDYLPIITTNLTLNYDAGFIPSYPINGTTWYDISTSNTNGTLTNGPTYNSNGYISFDATDDCVNITPSPNFGITNQFTIEVLCYPTTQVNGMFNFVGSNGYDRGIMAHWPWSSDYGYLDITSTSGNFYRWYKVSAGIQNVLALYQFRLDTSGNVSVRQNNKVMVPSGTDVFSGNVSLGSSSTIGAFYTNGSLAWGGNIYEFRIYNRALSEEEMSHNYYRANILTSNLSLVIDAGNILDISTSTTINDISGNNNTFNYEGAITRSSAFGGTLRLNTGRIYRDSLGWYGNYTISFWVKMEDLGFSGYFYTENFRGPGGCARIYSYFNSNGTFTYQVWDNSSIGPFGTGAFNVTTTTNVRDGNWHQITCIWSNGNSNRNRGIYVYCDGVQESYTDMIGNDGSYASMHLGGVSGCLGEVVSNSYLGPILQYNNVALSDTQVKQNYFAHLSRFK